jgi:hypothetical protein
MKLVSKLYPTAMGGSMRVKMNGEVYAGGASPTYSASGLAGVWAEENTRESIYSAFRRKEVFATSGPRIQVRFFGGYELDKSMLSSANGIEKGYAEGVSMGGTLLPKKSLSNGRDTENLSLAFIVMASADPESAPLQRLQIVKGWVDAEGAKEQVIDVACAGGGEIDAETNRCLGNGATVDISDCSINAETGEAQLSAYWQDPKFEPAQYAFYYARVIENPTCRWSTWDANRARVSPRADLPATIQERAWSSPINYIPK